MASYKGIYYDGINTQPHTVAVEIKPGQHMSLTLENGDTLNFDYSQIHSVEAINRNRFYVKLGATAPFQILEIEGAIDLFKHHNTFAETLPIEILSGGKWKIASIIAAVIISIASLTFWGIPYVGETIAYHLPHEAEISMGDNILKGMVDSSQIDSSRTTSLRELVKKFDWGNEYKIKVYVLNSPIVNAFALPGGNVVIHSGILNKMENPRELIGLLSHEVTHINQKHSLKALGRSLSSYFFFSFVLGDLAGISSVIVQNINTFTSLSYSRSLEEEADKIGVKLMVKNKIDPIGMVELMEILQKEHEETYRFISTHPLTSERIFYLKQLVKLNTTKFHPDPSLDSLWQNIKRTE
jgi:Zn-dependent protease with chaperone function